MSISALTISGPDVSELVATLTRITGGPGVAWQPAVVAGSDAAGRTCTVPIGGDAVEVFEVAAPIAAPESLTVAVDDAGAAVGRLRAAGYRVIEHEDLPVAATVTVAGICLRIAAERHG